MTSSIKLNVYVAFVMLVIFSSCGSRKDRALFNANSDLVTDTIKQVYVVNDQGISDGFYKIKVNDQIAIRNLQNKEFGVTASSAPSMPSLTGASTSSSGGGASSSILSYHVDLDGQVNLPAIGKVAVVGLTRREAAAKIQELYGEKLLIDPIIDLNLVNLKVTLLGEFTRQGNFYIDKESVTLIDIIGEAGGITKTADPKTLKIIRGDRANPEIIYVNLGDINSLASKKLTLQNNDILIIQETKTAAASQKFQSTSALIQPIFMLINVATLIFSLTR